MAPQTVTLTISHDVFEWAARLAGQTARSLENVLSERLESIMEIQDVRSLTAQGELDAFKHLSNGALMAFMRDQMPPELAERMTNLHSRLNGDTLLTREERDEMMQLTRYHIEIGRRKAEASAILEFRSYQVD